MIYMQSFKKSFNTIVNEKPSHLILGIFFIIYILLNVQTPSFIAGPIDNIFGKSIVVIVAIVIFMKTNPIVGILGLIAAYQLIQLSSISTGSYAINNYLPSEKQKEREMVYLNASHKMDGSLEEEMVEKMAPLVIKDGGAQLTYQPILDGQHDAAPLS